MFNVAGRGRGDIFCKRRIWAEPEQPATATSYRYLTLASTRGAANTPTQIFASARPAAGPQSPHTPLAVWGTARVPIRFIRILRTSLCGTLRGLRERCAHCGIFLQSGSSCFLQNKPLTLVCPAARSRQFDRLNTDQAGVRTR